MTDDGGRFRFDSVPAAGHELEVEHLGLPPSSERCNRAAVFVDGQ